MRHGDMLQMSKIHRRRRNGNLPMLVLMMLKMLVRMGFQLLVFVIYSEKDENEALDEKSPEYAGDDAYQKRL